MKRLLFLILFFSIGNIAWITPRPTSQFIASMDVLPATTDTHAVGTSANYFKSGYFRNVYMPYRAEAPTNIASYGVTWASTDNELYFTDATGTTTKLS